MNRFRLKVVGSMVLILAATVGVWFLRPGESPPAERVEKREKAAFKTQANTQKPKTDAGATAERAVSQRASEFEKRKAAQISSTAESLKTLYRNPDSPEAVKARQSLLKLPEGFAKSAPGTAAERAAISRFLNKTGSPQQAESAPNSPDRRTTTAPGPYSQPSGSPEVENVREPAQAALKEHLADYKATLNELFPMYQGSLPTGLINRLPAPYLQQVMKGTAQRDLPNPGVTAKTTSTRLTASWRDFLKRAGA